MATLKINGGKPLNGAVTASGNKNSIMPILCASLLTKEPVHLSNVPDITDVQKLLGFFKAIGSRVEFDAAAGELTLEHKDLTKDFPPEIVPSAMRSSIMLFAPLLFRQGFFRAHTNTKGCTLGVREIDPHLNLLEAFGYQIDATAGQIALKRARPVKGVRHWFEYASVTATESFAMAAATAEGKSVLNNAASEPHVQDLCKFLQLMGAKIDGAASNTLTIEGVREGELHGCRFRIPEDHHEVATWLAIGAITGGHVSVRHNIEHHMPLINKTFEKLGVNVECKGGLSAVNNGKPYRVAQPFTRNTFPKIEAAPWPYFPTDLLPPFIALATACQGNVLFWNKVYEGGLSWIPELNKFGAFAHLCDPHKVIVIGNTPLHPAAVESPYIIRAAIALLMVALSVPGTSVIQKADPICRAHPNFIEKLQSLGADVSWGE
jgi:UDP-N-acetylglucosamine 1-carboxyvinyltransferase